MCPIGPSFLLDGAQMKDEARPWRSRSQALSFIQVRRILRQVVASAYPEWETVVVWGSLVDRLGSSGIRVMSDDSASFSCPRWVAYCCLGRGQSQPPYNVESYQAVFLAKPQRSDAKRTARQIDRDNTACVSLAEYHPVSCTLSNRSTDQQPFLSP